MIQRLFLKRLLTHWLPVILWMAVIFVLSNQAALSTGNLKSAGFTWTLPFRSPTHFGLYFVLSLLLQRALDGRKHPVGLALLLSATYAISDEIHQSLVPGRSARLEDVIYDVSGTAVALSLVLVLNVHTVSRRALRWLNGS